MGKVIRVDFKNKSLVKIYTYGSARIRLLAVIVLILAIVLL
jgi:hypothetical protein